jgi:nucleoside-diphosphate-sugar epimerase
VRIVADLAATAATGVVNVASGESRTFASIVEDLRAVVPTDFTVEHAPGGATPTVRTFDLARLRSLLPDARFTPFREGLRAAYEWRAAQASGARA